MDKSSKKILFSKKPYKPCYAPITLTLSIILFGKLLVIGHSQTGTMSDYILRLVPCQTTFSDWYHVRLHSQTGTMSDYIAMKLPVIGHSQTGTMSDLHSQTGTMSDYILRLVPWQTTLPCDLCCHLLCKLN